jgi:hypothetical protein
MKLQIEIDCETVEEMFTHISVIRDQLKRRMKGWDKYDEPREAVTVEDNNCYGCHEAKLTLEDN